MLDFEMLVGDMIVDVAFQSTELEWPSVNSTDFRDLCLIEVVNLNEQLVGATKQGA